MRGGEGESWRAGGGGRSSPGESKEEEEGNGIKN